MTEQSKELTEQEIGRLTADLGLPNTTHTFVNTNPLSNTVLDLVAKIRELQTENERLNDILEQTNQKK